MMIDLRKIPTRWINLDSAKFNATEMEKQFSAIGFTETKRIPGRVIPAPTNPNPTLAKAFGSHFVGCGQSHIDCFADCSSVPLLILEDDAKITSDFTPTFEIPDGTDAVYLGVSHGNPKMIVVDMDKMWCRVFGMLATHAILYTSERYATYAKEMIRNCIYDLKIPLDMGFAQAQRQFNIIAARHPMFVQSDLREGANKWEKYTNKPLRATHALDSQKRLMPIRK